MHIVHHSGKNKEHSISFSVKYDATLEDGIQTQCGAPLEEERPAIEVGRRSLRTLRPYLLVNVPSLTTSRAPSAY